MSSSDAQNPASAQAADSAPQEAAPYELDDFTGQMPEPAPEQDQEGEGFRLLIVGGRQQDPKERAEREAAEIMEQANAAVAQAQQQAQSIRQQAYDEGYQQGMNEGMEASRAKMEAAASDLARSLSQLNRVHSDIMAGMEGEIVALVQAVCDRFFLKPQALPPQTLRSLVGQALARLGEAEKVSVKLSAADLETALAFRPELEKEIEGLGHLALELDETLSPGDCAAFSPIAQVDATLEGRRQRIFAALAEAFRQGPPLDLSQALEEGAKLGGPGAGAGAAPADEAGGPAAEELEDW